MHTNNLCQCIKEYLNDTTNSNKSEKTSSSITCYSLQQVRKLLINDHLLGNSSSCNLKSVGKYYANIEMFGQGMNEWLPTHWMILFTIGIITVFGHVLAFAYMLRISRTERHRYTYLKASLSLVDIFLGVSLMGKMIFLNPARNEFRNLTEVAKMVQDKFNISSSHEFDLNTDVAKVPLFFIRFLMNDLAFCCLVVSYFHITVTSFERYRAIVRPFRNRADMQSNDFPMSTLVKIWVPGLALSLIPYLMTILELQFPDLFDSKTDSTLFLVVLHLLISFFSLFIAFDDNFSTVCELL